MLTTEGWLRPTDAIDVRVRVIPDAPQALRHNMYVTVHTGSSEVVGRLRLLEKDVLEPGETSWAQVKLDAPLAVVKGDYYVIRSNSRTLGGGNIVETHARRHRRNDHSIIERLEVMELGSAQDILLKTIEASEPSRLDELVTRANMGADIGERLSLRQSQPRTLSLRWAARA